MTKQDFIAISEALSKLGDSSLNGDPMSFKGKIVLPVEDDKIMKIYCAFDAVGDIQVLEAAQQQKINFFVPVSIIEGNPLVILVQDKLELKEMSTFKHSSGKYCSINKWCDTGTEEELLIADLIVEGYGEDEYHKIKEFTNKYYLGNIYWRNIGFNKEGKIQCFDFQCGLSRNKEGKLYV